MTDIAVVMKYPKVTRRYFDHRIGTYQYGVVDPWQRQYESPISGLHMSVFQTRSNDVADGTYSCEARMNDSLPLEQVMAFGIFRNMNIYGKKMQLVLSMLRPNTS